MMQYPLYRKFNVLYENFPYGYHLRTVSVKKEDALKTQVGFLMDDVVLGDGVVLGFEI